MSIASCAALAISAGAFGGTTNLSFSNITGNAGQDIASQLKVSLSDVAGDATKVDVVFRNMVGVASSIKEVYFDAGPAGSIFSAGLIQSQTGASFVWGSGSPGNLPGGNSLTPAFETSLSLLAGSGNGGPTTGLDAASDSLTVRLTLASGKTYADVLNGVLADASASNSIRVGMHVTSIGASGKSDSYVSNLLIVPLPPAAWAGLACLTGVIGAGLVRSRLLRHRS